MQTVYQRGGQRAIEVVKLYGCKSRPTTSKSKSKSIIHNSLQANTDQMDANQNQAQAKTKVIYRLLLGNSRQTTNKSNSQFTLGLQILQVANQDRT